MHRSSINVCNGAFQTGPCRKQINESKTHALLSSAILLQQRLLRKFSNDQDFFFIEYLPAHRADTAAQKLLSIDDMRFNMGIDVFGFVLSW